MAKLLRFAAVFVLLIQPVLSIGPAGILPTQARADGSGETGGAPGRPIPAVPIPHHEPGRPSKAAPYTSQVRQVNPQGVEQTTTLTGLDALLNDGVIDDPLAGSSRLVNLDKILFSSFINYNSFSLRTFDITPTLHTITNSVISVGDYGFNDIAAGDLNADGQDEQIAAWIEPDGSISMSVGEILSLPAKATSAPAALAFGDGTGDLVVRGYDDALWHSHYDGAAWGAWDNAGGGFLLSAPAIVSQGAGQFDVFAIFSDNMVYQRHWAGGVFTGDWQLVDVAGYWPAVERAAPTPELEAPAVVARSSGQLDLFRRAADNTLRWRHFNGAAWEDWISLGGFLTTAPAAVSLPAVSPADDGMQVFAGGLKGDLWYRAYTGGSWGSWTPMEMPSGITAASAPTVASPQAGQIDVYMRGSDDALWRLQYAGGLWGAWSRGGGELGSGVGAAVWTGRLDLFAQNIDGTLQHSSDGTAWAGWTNLTPRWVYDTGADAAVPGADTALDNLLIDIDTGYFTGDGRQQIALVYQAPSNQIKVELYDVRDGFVPSKVAELAPPVTGSFARVAAADIDGNGVDDIVIAHMVPGYDHGAQYYYRVTSYAVEKDGDGSWTGSLVEMNSSPILRTCIFNDCGNYEDRWYWFAGTMRMEAGDLDGDQRDEVAVVSDWGDHRIEGLTDTYGLWIHLYLFDENVSHTSDDEICDPDTGGTKCFHAWDWFGTSSDITWDDGQGSGVGLAVGDVNLDTVDEIVMTCPAGFAGGDFPDLVRNLCVLDARAIDADHPTAATLASWTIPGWQRYTFLDAVATGDLDRDLTDEIILYSCDSLSLYEYNAGTLTQIALLDSGQGGLSNPYARSIKLVTGDFTGESLRLGLPTYRLQRNTGDIIAVLNEPPKHVDTLNGVTYDINSTDTGTYAAYENMLSQSTEMSIQVQRDWSFSDGMEMNVGDPEGTHVKNSLDFSYGEHFEDATTAFNQVDFGSEVKATSDDIVYYTGKDIQVWEYPVYEDNSRVPSGRILVVFPLPGDSNTGTREFYETGNSTCDFWYAPEHQVNNVWSYPQFPAQLKDYDPEKGVLNALQTVTVGPVEGEFWTSWQNITTTKQSSSVSMGVDSLFEWQIGGDTVEVSAAPFGIGVAYEVHTPYVKGTLEKSYGFGALSTHSVVGSNSTTVRVHFNQIATSGIYNYEVTPYLYWAKGGYLVLDYLTSPKNTTFWNLYNQPDPAFILPWADGHCAGKEQFSKDIVTSTPFASNGEMVNITATVHNFSNTAATNVRVRFYLGDPAKNVQIGADKFINLPGRGKVDVSVPWQASGTGEQRIYAVIDPKHDLPEMHDETTNSQGNNNVAFGVIAMGDSGYVDPGGQIYFDYQSLTYTNNHSLTANAFIPTAAMTETLRVEMQPLSLIGRIRNGFSLVAYKGGSDRNLPWDLVFQPMPAAILVRYTDAEVAGLNENALILNRYDRELGQWVDAGCGQYQRYPDENWMLVPVCRTGDFALQSPFQDVFLPVLRN